MGEDPPTSWTVPQLRAHYESLVETQGTTPTQEMADKLKEMMQKSRKKKAEFAEHLRHENITISENDTVQRLIAKAERQITEPYPPSGSELMGFGMHGSKTMKEVYESYKEYTRWCQETASEGETSWRLSRYVNFVENVKEEDNKIGNSKTAVTTMPMTNAAKADGYTKKKEFFIGDEHPSDTDGSFSLAPAGSMGAMSSGSQKDDSTEIQKLQMELAKIQEEKRELELQMSRSKNRREM